jgi:LacI family repressor for deo operon, udp, cdd, tsx, nupC, and nupG
MGQVSMQLLLQQIQGEPLSKMQHILDSELIVRDSCGGKGEKK